MIYILTQILLNPNLNVVTENNVNLTLTWGSCFEKSCTSKCQLGSIATILSFKCQTRREILIPHEIASYLFFSQGIKDI